MLTALNWHGAPGEPKDTVTVGAYNVLGKIHAGVIFCLVWSAQGKTKHVARKPLDPRTSSRLLLFLVGMIFYNMFGLY